MSTRLKGEKLQLRLVDSGMVQPLELLLSHIAHTINYQELLTNRISDTRPSYLPTLITLGGNESMATQGLITQPKYLEVKKQFANADYPYLQRAIDYANQIDPDLDLYVWDKAISPTVLFEKMARLFLLAENDQIIFKDQSQYFTTSFNKDLKLRVELGHTSPVNQTPKLTYGLFNNANKRKAHIDLTFPVKREDQSNEARQTVGGVAYLAQLPLVISQLEFYSQPNKREKDLNDPEKYIHLNHHKNINSLLTIVARNLRQISSILASRRDIAIKFASTKNLIDPQTLQKLMSESVVIRQDVALECYREILVAGAYSARFVIEQLPKELVQLLFGRPFTASFHPDATKTELDNLLTYLKNNSYQPSLLDSSG